MKRCVPLFYRHLPDPATCGPIRLPPHMTKPGGGMNSFCPRALEGNKNRETHFEAADTSVSSLSLKISLSNGAFLVNHISVAEGATLRCPRILYDLSREHRLFAGERQTKSPWTESTDSAHGLESAIITGPRNGGRCPPRPRPAPAAVRRSESSGRTARR